MSEIKAGQVWASNRTAHRANGWGQRREVVGKYADYAQLRHQGTSRRSWVRSKRTADGWTIPGHRLVEDVQ
jgi:hypothetical protein